MSTSELASNVSVARFQDQLLPAPKPPVAFALVYMPWGAVSRGAIAVSLLKQVLKRHEYSSDVHYLNIRFAREIGIDLYTKISEASAFFPEWFFSNALFGPGGLGLLENSWDSLSGPLGTRFKSELASIAGGTEDLCKRIAEEAVPRFINGCLGAFDWSKYAAVGFSVTFAQTTAALLLARQIRQSHPGVKIIFGGASVDSEMGFEILKGFNWIDYVVHGEGEHSFPQLLNNIVSGNVSAQVPGVSMRENGRLHPAFASAVPVQNMDDSPAPDYSDYIHAIREAGFEKNVRISLPFEASRGCWWGAKHHCTFCGLNGNSMGYRKKSPARVYEEVLAISREYRCLSLDAVDNILAMEYFHELLPKLAEANFDLSLFFEVKANMTRRQVELLRASGITRIQPGIESVSTRLLKLMNKGVTAIQNIQLLKWCYEFGIFPSWNVLHGFPGEAPEDYAHFPQIFRAVSHLCPPTGTCRVIFERFSPYHFDREKYSLMLEPSPFYRLLFPESLVDLEKLAYYFDRKGAGNSGEEVEYFKPSLDFIQLWQEAWKERKWFCYFEKGPGFITIYDNRPLAAAMNSTARKTTLRALGADVYLFCDEHRSFKAIQEMVNKDRPNPMELEKIKAMLNQLVSAGLMFEEDGRYLSLAVHKKAQNLSN